MLLAENDTGWGASLITQTASLLFCDILICSSSQWVGGIYDVEDNPLYSILISPRTVLTNTPRVVFFDTLAISKLNQIDTQTLSFTQVMCLEYPLSLSLP